MGPQNIYWNVPYGSCQDVFVQKETDAKRGPQQHPTTWVGYYLSCQDGPFKTKLLPNRVHGNIQQPNWPLRRLSRRQKKLLKWAPRTSSCRSGPYGGCQDGPLQNETAAKRDPQQHRTTEAGPNNRSGPQPHWGSLSRRGSSKDKLLPKRVNDIQLPERASTETIKAGPIRKETAANWHTAGSNYRSGPLLRLSRRIPSKKETAAKAGPRQYPTTEAGPTWADRRAPSKKKLLPKRANNIQLPERAPAEAVKTDPSKKECWLKRSSTTCIVGAGPYLLQKFWSWRAVASPRGASGATCPPPPPNLRSDTPWDRCRSEEIFVSEKMGVGLQDLLRRFTCTDATVDVLWSYDYEKRGSCGSCWRSYSGRPSVKLRGPLGSFSPGIGPPNHKIFILKNVNLGPLPENSGPNPMSFQFLTGGRLT